MSYKDRSENVKEIILIEIYNGLSLVNEAFMGKKCILDGLISASK